MASITIRNLDENIKSALRERAARNGRSMEEEARVYLGELIGMGTHSDQPIQALRIPSLPTNNSAPNVDILLIICGGIAAYKALEFIRLLKKAGLSMAIVMTKAASEFITPLSVESLSHTKVYTELFDRAAEHDIGHIRLARNARQIIVAPATANIIAKAAHGLVDDLASAILAASRVPITLAPAMNPAMWSNPANQHNIAILRERGFDLIGPEEGEMAEQGESGLGRMVEPATIAEQIIAKTTAHREPTANNAQRRDGPLEGKKAIVTAGPTHEPIDPVRYIANRSSGKQGFAIAKALAEAGAQVTLIAGPVNLPTPLGVKRWDVETAQEMLEAVKASLPADIAVMVAAVADWRPAASNDQKIKKKPDNPQPPTLDLKENPDILHWLGHCEARPYLVVGFAAETENLLENATRKLKHKGADWIVANDVSDPMGVMGGDHNQIKILSREGILPLPALEKSEVGERLVDKMIEFFESHTSHA